MPFRLRHIDDLTDEVGTKQKAEELLRAADIRVVNGFFDDGALHAVFAEPKATNIGRKAKDRWTIAETDGIGALKAVLDRVGLDIVRHLYHATNYLTVRNGKGRRRRCKVYSASRTHTQWQVAKYSVTGFLDPTQPSYYLFICYEGPIAWALSRQQLRTLHTRCLENEGVHPQVPNVSIPVKKMAHPRGCLSIGLEASDERYLLQAAKQLGL